MTNRPLVETPRRTAIRQHWSPAAPDGARADAPASEKDAVAAVAEVIRSFARKRDTAPAVCTADWF